ncbi:MAG: sigma-54-dependent transcriptional regulator, partial [Nitrospiraceae bacterium]
MPNSDLILVVDDDEQNLTMLAEALGRHGFRVETARGGEEALQKAGWHEYATVVSDIQMAPLSGLDLLESLRKVTPDTPVVLLTAFGSVDTAIRAMKSGAFDYITKPIHLDELVLVTERAVKHSRLLHEYRHLRSALSERVRAAPVIAQSRKMLDVFKIVGKVAGSQASILIQGETGTGKEIIARTIHDNSLRRGHRFVPVNCSAIPDSLLESELFGHVKGSFTDAHRFRKGLLQESSGGTLFLDEIGDLSPAGQAKLLRALEEGKVRPVGDNEFVDVHLRVIAASHYDLQELVQKGEFREDLLYRLKTIVITLPPLRERPEDIPLLAELFLARFGGEKSIAVISKEAMDLLLRYTWPGNVRELEHVMERAAALAASTVLSPDDLPQEIRECEDDENELVQARRKSKKLDRDQVLATLRLSAGNKEDAAQRLG